MCIGCTDHLAYPSYQLTKRRIARKVGSQDERVEGKPYESLNLRARALRYHRTNHEIILACVAIQQGLERSYHRHEQAGAFLKTQRFEGIPQVLSQRERLDRATACWQREVGMSNGQFQVGGSPFKLLLPVAQALREPFACQLLALPTRKIGVLERQVGQG